MSERTFPWRTLLFVSVALNLLVVGAIAGGFTAGVRLEREAPEVAVARMPGARAFMAALPPETRAKVRSELADSWVQSREMRRAAAQARREAFDAAGTEPYDVARVRAAFARLRAADQAAIGVFHDNVVEAFATLTPQERREALDALRRAAPARRTNVAPEADGAAPAGQPEIDRETIRERIRERRRERRERLERQQ
jgi:uncharacterized membrane protein